MIKNEAELKRLLMSDCCGALAKAQDEVYKIIDLYLQRFYADYDPVIYERTRQLLHSLVKSSIRKEGNELIAEVYFELNYKYKTGARPSGEDVMFEASHGGHGAKGLKVVYGSGEDVWYTPLEILDAQAIDILVQMLISEGVPIR